MVKIDKSDSQKAIVTIYAYVGSWDFDASSFQRLLDDLADFPLIVIRLHTYGGTVFDGNVMFNAALDSKKIEIEVVGVVASMGTIFLQGARPGGRKMVENGFMMIHAPSGFTDGNAKQHLANAKLLQAMEKQFIKVYGQHKNAKPNGTAKYLDGTDHWLSAEDALAEGLIDAIIPSIVDGPQELTVEAVAQLGPKAAFEKFTASLEAGEKPPKTVNQNFKMKQALIDKYGLKGVTAESSDADVQAALDAHLASVETKAKEDAKTDAETTAKASLQKTIETMVKAQVGKKITANQEASFVAIGVNAGIDALQTALDAIKPAATITGMLGGAGGGANPVAKNREGWDWDKYQAEASAELEQMETSDPENFKALFKAKYGVEPKSK